MATALSTKAKLTTGGFSKPVAVKPITAEIKPSEGEIKLAEIAKSPPTNIVSVTPQAGKVSLCGSCYIRRFQIS